MSGPYLAKYVLEKGSVYSSTLMKRVVYLEMKNGVYEVNYMTTDVARNTSSTSMFSQSYVLAEAKNEFMDVVTTSIQGGYVVKDLDDFTEKQRRLSKEVLEFYREQFMKKHIRITKVHSPELVDFINETGVVYGIYEDDSRDVQVAVKLDVGIGIDLILGKDSWETIS